MQMQAHEDVGGGSGGMALALIDAENCMLLCFLVLAEFAIMSHHSLCGAV
jgi:hypothetical protein